jgi:Zn-dependent protease with chaperone function
VEEKVTLFISEDGQDKKVICEAQFSERGVTLGPLSPDEQHSVNGPWQFSWDQLKLYLGGAYEKLLFFEFAGTPEGSFYIEASRGHLKSLGKIQNPTLSEKLSPILTKKLRSTGLFYGTIFSLFFALGLLWVSRGAIAEKLTAFVPYSVEQKLGGKILSVMLPEMSRYADENVKKELDNLLAPVLKVLDHPEDYQFYISRSGELNAFALPG